MFEQRETAVAMELVESAEVVGAPGTGETRGIAEHGFQAFGHDDVVAAAHLTDHAHEVGQVLDRFNGPSLSRHMEERGTLDQFREFAIHRSAYQLKEADPHSWGIPRFSGPRKAALIEIQKRWGMGDMREKPKRTEPATV